METNGTLAKQTVNVTTLLNESAWSTYQKLVTVLAALATIFDGFDIQILGFTIPSLMRDWHVARSVFAPVLAVGLVGLAVGSLIGGHIGDRYGRRVGLISSVVLFGLATVATAMVHGMVGLTVLRLLTGMGTGAAFPSISALANEFAPLRRSVSAVKLTVLCVPLGGMLGGVLATWILPTLGWRGLYVIGGGLPLFLAGVLFMALPESPRFLARRPAQWPQLIALLKRFGHSLASDTEFEEDQPGHGSERVSVRALFAPSLRRDTVSLWLTFFSCLGSIYLVFGWLPALLTTRGFDSATASSGLAIYNFGGVLGVLIWAVLVPLLGSRVPLVSGSLACAASALALLLVPMQVQGSHTLLMVFLGINGLLANAIQASLYALAAYVYPTKIRATGVAYCSTLGRTGGLLSSLWGASIIQAGASHYWEVLAIAMVVAAAGLAFVRSHYPAATLSTMTSQLD
jgi:AAHS family 4-hydroxybenzoate transporter-like MFS transporter